MTQANDINAYANIRARFDAFVPRIDTITLQGNLTLEILRLDEIHPYISGNKWYKLKYNIAYAIEQGADTLITFGGAYSNHLVAVADVARLSGLKCVCIIRGEEPKVYNARLAFVTAAGGMLHFVSRSAYVLKETHTEINKIITHYSKGYLIPEGGANTLGVKGCLDILKHVSTKYDIIACAAGTGTMAAGIIQAAPVHTQVYIFPAINLGDVPPNETPLYKDIERYLDNPKTDFKIITGYTFGGYARTNDTLNDFILWFMNTYSIPLDRIYTGKLIYGILDMFNKGLISKHTRVLAIHSGGVFNGL